MIFQTRLSNYVGLDSSECEVQMRARIVPVQKLLTPHWTYFPVCATEAINTWRSTDQAGGIHC